MNQHETSAALKAIIEPLIIKKGFDLVQIKLRRLGKEQVLSIFTDRHSGGITIAECAALNEEIRDLLEKEAALEQPYSIEVSSPGLDSPLIERKDFLRAIRRNLRVFLKDQMEIGLEHKKKNELIGELVDVRGDAISLDTEDGLLLIPLNNITKAKQVIE